MTAWILAAMSALAAGQSDRPTKAITVTVLDTPRQMFRGLGTSILPNANYAKLTDAQRREMGKRIWKDMNLRVARLWFDVAEFAPTADKRNAKPFRRGYVTSKRIKTALDNGCEQLLLAPCGQFPAWLRGPKPRKAGGQRRAAPWPLVAPGKEKDYARLLADFIKLLRDRDGVRITATGIYNEPSPEWGWDWMVKVVKALRAELDARGLKDVRIIAPETCNTDWVWDGFAGAIEKDPVAQKALGGTASHSYNMAGNDHVDAYVARTGKDYWMTEAGGNGPETLPDPEHGASAACRMLGDFNHGVGYWIWFLADEHHDPRDDKTRLIRWWPNPHFKYERLTQYEYLLHLSKVFPPGTVGRRCTSDVNGTMTWTYGLKPWLVAAAGVRPDGTWVIAVCNNTSPRFDPRPPARVPSPGQATAPDADLKKALSGDDGKPAAAPEPPPLSQWERSQGLHPAHDLVVTFNLPAGSKLAAATFLVRRTNAKATMQPAGEVRAADGKVTVTIAPMELVTLEAR